MKIKDVVVRNGLLGIATGLSFVSLETRTEVGVPGATNDRTRGEDVPVKILRVNVETGEQTLWRELAPANRTEVIPGFVIRVGADCKSSAYSAQYGLSELWLVDGLR
jgi:hypothetical protein